MHEHGAILRSRFLLKVVFALIQLVESLRIGALGCIGIVRGLDNVELVSSIGGEYTCQRFIAKLRRTPSTIPL